MRTETNTRDSGTTHALAKSKVCVQLCEHDTSCSNFEASSEEIVVVSVFVQSSASQKVSTSSASQKSSFASSSASSNSCSSSTSTWESSRSHPWNKPSKPKTETKAVILEPGDTCSNTEETCCHPAARSRTTTVSATRRGCVPVTSSFFSFCLSSVKSFLSLKIATAPMVKKTTAE